MGPSVDNHSTRPAAALVHDVAVVVADRLRLFCFRLALAVVMLLAAECHLALAIWLLRDMHFVRARRVFQKYFSAVGIALVHCGIEGLLVEQVLHHARAFLECATRPRADQPPSALLDGRFRTVGVRFVMRPEIDKRHMQSVGVARRIHERTRGR